MPKVSVVIGAYNCERFIEETVMSVIGQTFDDWELIIVDDGSKDGTYEKINAIRDKRIRIFRCDRNSRCPAVPRNIGIRVATGDYIAFLDHDDIWLPQKLSKQVQFMEENRDVMLVYTKCYVSRNGSRTEIMPKRPKSGYVFKDLFLKNCIACSTVMIRKRGQPGPYLFNESRDLSTIEDYDLWLSIAYREKISFIDEPLVVYRLHSQNASASVTQFFKRHRLVIKKYASSVPKDLLWMVYISLYVNFYVSYARIIIRSLFASLLKDGLLRSARQKI